MTKAKVKKSSHYHIGFYGIIVALSFAAIPFYRMFCEHIGLLGNNDKKTYEFNDKQSTLMPILVVNHKKYKVKFEAIAQPGINWEFEPVQKEVLVGTSESAIVFYRLRNK
jgi:cytochrome c oxidase assembly protein subunit 11